MARRLTPESETWPVASHLSLPPLVVSKFLDLPGAVFYGNVLDEDVEIARHWQEIREEYEQTGCITTLWHTLDGMGWPTSAIVDAVVSPASIIATVYSSDWRATLAMLPALLAVETAA